MARLRLTSKMGLSKSMRTRIKATLQKNHMIDTRVVVEVVLTNVSTVLNLAGKELNE